MALTDAQVFFDGNDISAVASASLIDHNFNNLPNREIKSFKLARTNKSVTTSAEYRDKEVSILLHLRGCERSDAELVLSNLKALLRGASRSLVVSQFGSDIQYDGATLNEADFRWLSNKILLTLVFHVADPIGYSQDETVMLDTSVTSASSSLGVSNIGSFDALPIITLAYSVLTGGTSQDVTIKNEETGQGITISRTWTAGDSVEINSVTNSVTINGANVDYSGTFPRFAPGTGAFGYRDTFTTRTVAIDVIYNARYI